MTEIDKRFKRQSIENFESDLPYINLSIADNLSTIKSVAFLFLGLALITPFLPPRNQKWTFPTTWTEYFSRVSYFLIFAGFIVGLVFISNILSNLRTLIDRRFGSKKVGTFKVTNVWRLFARQIVFLNNKHFLILRKKDYCFDKIKAGYNVAIERTATNKLLDCRITK